MFARSAPVVGAAAPVSRILASVQRDAVQDRALTPPICQPRSVPFQNMPVVAAHRTAGVPEIARAVRFVMSAFVPLAAALAFTCVRTWAKLPLRSLLRSGLSPKVQVFGYVLTICAYAGAAQRKARMERAMRFIQAP
ncbi:MAG: hypothetical protein C4555_05175 [Dehalococcoidia bacterium]|nr:MAG: hypothetical protein C4555_05175 [Dehalococcoidia bacterium]